MMKLTRRPIKDSRRRYRPFTLLEILVVVLLIAVMAGAGTWSLTDLLAYHRREAEADELKNLLQELQIEALALRADLEVSFDQDKGVLKVKSKTAEKILRDRSIEMKAVQRMTINEKEQKKMTFQILSTGRFDPPALIGIERKEKPLWIDLRQPLQIKYSEARPAKIVELIPDKPKET